jgi:putative intracellular protease/amidase
MVKPKCGEYTGDDVTVDGKIVTGRDPLAAKKFGEEILKMLEA